MLDAPAIAPQIQSAVPLAPTAAKRSPLSLERMAMAYEPYPIGFFGEAFSEADYRELLETWPPDHFFAYMPKLGEKYSLSERNNAQNYEWFIANSPAWGRLHSYLKSPDFTAYVLQRLEAQHIVLGLRPEQLSTRFEFSMMGAAGGHIRPHTDLPQKICTLVVFMVRPGEWEPRYGGGTSVVKMLDPTRSFNQLSELHNFDEVHCLHTFPYAANCGIVFIKTFNSWHAVYPMTGPANLMRRSLTINIEDRRLEPVRPGATSARQGASMAR